MPPMSAWWPRAATKNCGPAPASRNTGITTVTSGRWVPPAYGALSANASPGCMTPTRARRRRISCTDSPMLPRCTGMWGAFAMSCPAASNNAHEKSSRSLMFTELAVFASVTPICSAIAMNRLLKISSRTGSARVDSFSRACAAPLFSSTRWSASVRCRAPAALDDDRRIRLADHRGPRERIAGTQIAARVERRVDPPGRRSTPADARPPEAAPARGGNTGRLSAFSPRARRRRPRSRR